MSALGSAPTRRVPTSSWPGNVAIGATPQIREVSDVRRKCATGALAAFRCQPPLAGSAWQPRPVMTRASSSNPTANCRVLPYHHDRLGQTFVAAARRVLAGGPARDDRGCGDRAERGPSGTRGVRSRALPMWWPRRYPGLPDAPPFHVGAARGRALRDARLPLTRRRVENGRVDRRDRPAVARAPSRGAHLAARNGSCDAVRLVDHSRRSSSARVNSPHL
jgi:hypothetical protein